MTTQSCGGEAAMCSEGRFFCDAALLRNAGSWTAARLAPAWLLGGNRQPAQLESAHVILLRASADACLLAGSLLWHMLKDQTSILREL